MRLGTASKTEKDTRNRVIKWRLWFRSLTAKNMERAIQLYRDQCLGLPLVGHKTPRISKCFDMIIFEAFVSLPLFSLLT